MAGIFDLLGGMSPEQNQGLLAAAAQVLRNSGPGRPYTIGMGLGDAIGAYQGNMEYQKQRKAKDQFQALELEDAQLGLQSRRAARDEAQQISDAMRGAVGQNGVDYDALIKSVMRINPMKGIELQRSLAKAGPKFDSGITFVNGPDGRPVAVRTADDGSIKQLDGLAPREKLELENLGGRSVAVNPYELQPGQQFQRTATPGDLLSAATARRGQDITARGQNMTDARAREEFALKQQMGKAPTEFQGKSAAFGLRATEADKILTGLTGQYNPAAVNAKTNVESWPLIGGALGAATNRFGLNANDQKAEQAQRDFINAVLRQESGAAIGDNEFDNARKQYFPQPGDGPEVIAQKARNRQLAIQGFNSNAGRAAMTAPPAATSSGWSIQRVD